jgi:neutral ceramidase
METSYKNRSIKSEDLFLAGAAKVDITPALGSFVGVDFYNHFARFIHDPLFAKAIVFKKETKLIVMVVIDICIIPSDMLNDMKLLIQERTGIGRENIMISCTHTHGAANVAGLLLGGVDIVAQRKLPGQIVESVVLALKNMKPAKIASGSVDVPEHLLCRRYLMKESYVPVNPMTGKADQVKTNPFGVEHLIDIPASPTDPGVGFLAVKGLDERWIAVLGNYSSHYAGDWHVDTITADIYGEFSAQVKEKLNAGDDFVGMLTLGTGGDVNHWDFQNPDRYPKEEFAKTKIIAGDISDRVVESLKNIEWQDNPALAVQYEELELAVRKPSPEDVDAAAKIFVEKDYDNMEINLEGFIRVYAREQLLLNEYPATCISAVQAIKVGNLIMGALGGEFFSETGLFLKKSITGNNYFSICLANSYGGYIAPAYEIERGGYEVWRARSSFMESGAESKIRNKMLELVERF